MTGDALAVRDLAVGYPGRTVAADISISVAAGGLLGVVGQNGSGKTTFLRTLLGILPPCAGSIERAPGFRPGYVPQRDAVDPVFPFRVREVVEMAALPEAWMPFAGRRRRRERAMEALRRTGMDAEAESPFRDLSGGQRQRVLVARALAAEPTFLALDEPTTGMDLAAVEEFYDLLRDLRRRDGLTVALVSHSLDRVADEATDVLLFHDGTHRCGPAGKVLTEASLEALYGVAVRLRRGAGS